jgi:hypothetical protein
VRGRHHTSSPARCIPAPDAGSHHQRPKASSLQAAPDHFPSADTRHHSTAAQVVDDDALQPGPPRPRRPRASRVPHADAHPRHDGQERRQGGSEPRALRRGRGGALGPVRTCSLLCVLVLWRRCEVFQSRRKARARRRRRYNSPLARAEEAARTGRARTCADCNISDSYSAVAVSPPFQHDRFLATAVHASRVLTEHTCARRRQWIQDTRAHVRQVASSLGDVDHGFPAVAVPGNAELASEVNIANEQQQLVLEAQDEALDRIEKAAQRVGQLGLEIHRELGVRFSV